MNKPTRTYNKIHFEDLDPIRFEDLCLSMVYRMQRWKDINHYGKKGADDGIDIHAVESLENDKERVWYFQCKRYLKIVKSDITNVVDSIVSKNDILPNNIVLIASCNIRKSNIEYFKSYSKDKGINNAFIWTSSVLEAKLYSEYHDLLFSYFGVNLNTEKNNRISTVRRNIELKKEMKRDFLKGNIPVDQFNEIVRKPHLKFNSTEFLIRSVDDVYYPENIADEYGNYPWFKVEAHDFYHNGLYVVTGIVTIVFNDKNYWDFKTDDDDLLIEQGLIKTTNVIEISKLPFENIIAYDIDGDEHYMYPHIYCDFSFMGHPFEGKEFLVTKDGGINFYLDFEMKGI